MGRMTRAICLLMMMLLATACRKDEPPAPTTMESGQLNEAEDMLNAAAKEEGPADRSTGPSNSSD